GTARLAPHGLRGRGGLRAARASRRRVMGAGTKVVLVALAAGVLGIVAGLMTTGPGPLLRTELGQRVLGEAMEASAPPVPAGVSVARRGETIPSIVLPDLAGRRVALPAAYAGRPVLINLWASWCGPCVTEMPALQAFAAE